MHGYTRISSIIIESTETIDCSLVRDLLCNFYTLATCQFSIVTCHAIPKLRNDTLTRTESLCLCGDSLPHCDLDQGCPGGLVDNGVMRAAVRAASLALYTRCALPSVWGLIRFRWAQSLQET
jgi:hypothetical protein